MDGERGVPRDTRELYQKMLQSNVGIAESVTRAEIEYRIDLTDLDGSLDTVLRSMVGQGLAKQREEIISPVDDGSPHGQRRVKTYQVLPKGLK